MLTHRFKIAGIQAGGILIAAAVSAFAGSPAFSQAEESRLHAALKSIPGAIVKKIDPGVDYKEAFEIWLRQPVDHQDPTKGYFQQRIFLAHKGFENPVVLETEGYAATWFRRREMSGLLDGNQIIAEHRFFGISVPKPLNWDYLTIRQAASDHHRIVGIFKEIYKGKWLTSGRSKGGMAALFHKVLYPDDVDATVVYAAPIMLGLKDERFYKFLEGAGDEEGRNKIRNFQVRLLNNREAMLDLLKKYKTTSGMDFPLDDEIIFEYAVVQYPLSFWQGRKSAYSIPADSASCEQMFDHLNSTVPFSSFSKKTLEMEGPLVYQSVTELGYHGFPIDHIRQLLKALPDPDYSIFSPADAAGKFNSQQMADVLSFLQEKGDNIIYLYGELDPWTACCVEPTARTNAIKIVQKGIAHSVGIKDLFPEEKAAVYKALEEWLSMPVPARE